MELRALRLPLGFLIAVLVLGVPYWRLPYGRADLPGAFLGAGFVVLAGIAVMLVAVPESRLRRVLSVMALCPAAVVAVRIVADTAADPTTHNLWPFELVIALLVGAAAVLPALAAGLIARYFSRGASG